ncbi:MAG TPA: ABC transporter ATP-binding protein [Bacillota bacterium]|nr:ABC transporter ATP-binding protein [Bacillota bacterium]
MIELTNITKKYGRKWVLKDISMHIPKGEMTCLVGRNSVGKTTIMNMIMGLTHPTAGKITIDGEEIHPALYEKISYIPDQMIMVNQMTVGDAIAFMKAFYRHWNDERASALLYKFSLHRSDKIRKLSKGARGKVNMLLGLSIDADYILLDEPFSGIDPISREQILDVCMQQLVEGKGILITTHDLQELEQFADRAVLIEDGMIHRAFELEDMRATEGKTILDILREVDSNAQGE